MRLQDGYVYLDWAATTPLCEEASEAMAPFMRPGYANVAFGMNANSLHTPGRNAFSSLEDARAAISRAVGAARPSEIIFTGGATESNNAAIRGIISARVKRERQRGNRDYVPHFITSAIEHDAVLSLLPELRERGCDVTVLKPNRSGLISPDDLRDALRPTTALVSIMWANNEIGTVQPVKDLAATAHAVGASFHCDATQAVGKIPIEFSKSGIDAASFSSHKLCGPKGVGGMYLRTGTGFQALMLGGGQESGRRSGTQNVAGIVGFAAACSYTCANAASEMTRLAQLRDRLYEGLCALGQTKRTIPEGSDVPFLPNIVSVLVPGFESETLILQLDIAGFAVSGGSACSSGSLSASHVLTAIGIPSDEALCSLRVSIGRYTTEDEVERFIDAFGKIVER